MSLDAGIARFFKESMGLDVESLGAAKVEQMLQAYLRRRDWPDLVVLQERIAASAEERQALLEELIVPETWFFRGRESFEYLRQYAAEHRGIADGVRMLSAPCSTGEEPYSMVMTFLAAGWPAEQVWVDAVDLSARSLDWARQAVYEKKAFREDDDPAVRKYFESRPLGRLAVAEAVTARVHFHHANLVKPDYLREAAPYDLLFCRNMLIYLNPEAKACVLENIRRLLRPGGLLFTGPTELIYFYQRGFQPVDNPRAFACRHVPGAELCRPAAAPRIPAVPRRPQAQPAPVRPAPAAPAVRPPPAPPPAAGPAVDLDQVRALADAGRLAEAASACAQHLEERPADPEAHYLFGLIQEAQDRPRAAEEYYHKVLYLDPGHRATLAQLSLMYRAQGDAQREALYRARLQRLGPPPRAGR